MFALAKEHNHRTGEMVSSVRRLAKIASVSSRHTHTCLVNIERRGEIRRRRGKHRNDLSSFEFLNFHFIPKGNDAPVLNSRVEVASTPAVEVASARNKEGRKNKVNQIPPTPLFQRGDDDDPVVKRRRLTTRDVRMLVEKIDSIYKASVGRAIEFREAFETACGACLIHPDDARRAIGMTQDFDWDRKRPPERAVS
jgi:hypothetical protein